MKLKIRPLGIIQYILCFVMISFAGALWFEEIKIPLTIAVWVCYLYILARGYNQTKLAPVYACGILLVVITFVRFMTNGGIGITDWLTVSGQIMLVYLVVAVSDDQILAKYINLCTLMSLISLAFYFVQLTNSEILTELLPQIKYHDHTVYGRYLYVFRPYNLIVEANRNNGIFTEPGRYQIPLIASFLILLFFRKELNKTNTTYFFAIVVNVLTIISTGSTTGYVSIGIVVAAYMIMKEKEAKSTKRRIVMIFVIAIVLLLADYNSRAGESLVGKYLLDKLVSTDIQEAGSSGGARMRMIELSIQTMMSHPLGAGQQYITDRIVVDNSHGAGLLRFIAAVGVLPGIGILIWLIKPTFEKSILLGVCIVLVYVNIGLSQTYAVYSPLILIPTYIRLYSHHRSKRKEPYAYKQIY